MSKKKQFKWIVEIEINETWVADGYEATAENVKQAILAHSLGYAYESEVNVKQISKPLKSEIDRVQGAIKPCYGRK